MQRNGLPTPPHQEAKDVEQLEAVVTHPRLEVNPQASAALMPRSAGMWCRVSRAGGNYCRNSRKPTPIASALALTNTSVVMIFPDALGKRRLISLMMCSMVFPFSDTRRSDDLQTGTESRQPLFVRAAVILRKSKNSNGQQAFGRHRVEKSGRLA